MARRPAWCRFRLLADAAGSVLGEGDRADEDAVGTLDNPTQRDQDVDIVVGVVEPHREVSPVALVHLDRVEDVLLVAGEVVRVGGGLHRVRHD